MSKGAAPASPGPNDQKIILVVTADKARHAEIESLVRARISDTKIFWSADALSALQKAENVPPHVIVMDLDMAKMAGTKFIHGILARPKMDDTAFIVVGALPKKEALLDELVTGRVQFLPDTAIASDLISCLTKSLNFALNGKMTSYSLKLLMPGEVLLKEGDKATSVFIVKKGELRAVKAGVELGKIVKGEFIGEMAYINGEPRSADVEALTDCELIEISVGTLDRILFSRPAWCKSLMQTLTKRLKQANLKKSAES